MVIGCERYLDDTSRYQVGLALTTRTLEMHGVLSAVPPEIREGITEILVRALDDIQALLTPVLATSQATPETSSFGCGT